MDKLKTFFLSIRKSVWGLIVFVFFMGLWISGPDQVQPNAGIQEHGDETKVEFWTCAMHPQIRLNEPGQCPICFMDLIPVESSGGEESPRELKMSETA
ncbi:MAG: heavy metal-binding domain-containing protein, partial [Candidatus Neomarinimicrobiota bacterium]